MVPMPKIGGGDEGQNKEGPWPQCVGWTGEKCKTWIESFAEDLRGNVYILPEDSMMTMDFRTDRVRILVDGNDLVSQTPSRG
jgi:hypothetical protein